MTEDAVFDRIKYENELINQRLTWLGTFQGLLLAALAFAWGKSSATAIVCVICVVGAIVALSTWVATFRANKAISLFSVHWDSIKPKEYSGVGVEGVRSRSGYFWWLMPGYALPWLFFLAWLVIGFIHYAVALKRFGRRICKPL